MITCGTSCCVNGSFCFSHEFPEDCKNTFSTEPVNIFLQSSRCRINRAKSIFNFIFAGRAGDMVCSYVFHQMVKGDIIGNISITVHVVDFIFFGNAGTYKGEFICDIHIFSGINSSTHQRTVHRKEFWKKLRLIAFNIPNHCRTGL